MADSVSEAPVSHAAEQSEQDHLRFLAALTSYRYSVRLQDGVPVATTHTPGCLTATGYSPEEYARDPKLWLMMIDPEDQSRVLKQVSRAIAGHEVPPIEHRITHRDGTTRWIRDTIVLHRDRQGRVDRYDGLVEDITERKEAEELLRQFLESAPDAIVVVAPDGTIVIVNAQTERLFGYQREELLGHPLEVLIPDEYRGLHRQHCDQYTASPRSRLMGAGREVQGVRKDGSEFPASVTLSSLQARDKRLLVSSIRDVTLERRRETSQLVAEARMLAAQKIQERLLPTVPPRMPGIDVSGAVCAADFVAGDYFDYFDTDEGSLVLAIGDVSGHGVGPGLMMATTHAIVRTLLRSNGSLKEVLHAVNREFFEDETELFITLLLGRLSPGKRQFEFVNAGHPKGYVIDGAGNVKSTLGPCCMALGVVGDVPARDPQTVQIGAGDVILLLTDGALEAVGPGGEYFGAERVLQTLHGLVSKSGREIVAGIYAAIREFTAGKPACDDVTALVVKIETVG
jgi:sigma-B regulation protein RsbU (phosphoserine phosphatase)